MPSDAESQPAPPNPGAVRPLSRRAAHRRRRRRRIIGLIVLAIAILCGLIVARPVYRGIKKWQARNIVSQAEELARQQMFTEAIERLDIALKLDPSSVEGLRTIAGIYSRFELPYALPFWRALLAQPGHTDSDVHAYVELALRLQRFDLAESELAQLLARTNVSTQTRIQATEFFFRQGDLARARAFADEVRRSDPANRLNQIRVAKVLLQVPSGEAQREGVTLLLSLTNLTAHERINVLQILGEAVDLPHDQARQLLDQLPFPASASPVEYLLRADALLRLSPAERSRIVADAVSRYHSGTPEQQSDLSQWLNRIGEHAVLLEAFRLEDAVKHPPTLANYLEALARAGRWTEVQKAVAAPLPLETWLLECLRATSAARLKQDALAREHWRRAFDEASGNPAKLRSLGDVALRLGATDSAVRAFNLMTRDRLSRVAGYRRLAQMYDRLRETERLRAVMREWSAHVPDDPIPDNAFCYLSGLLRKDIAVAYPKSVKLLERLPNRAAHRTTVALLELRRDQPQAALQLLERARLDPKAGPPQSRLVHALVLDANGRSAEARDAVRDLKPELLLPEEKDLLRRLLNAE